MSFITGDIKAKLQYFEVLDKSSCLKVCLMCTDEISLVGWPLLLNRCGVLVGATCAARRKKKIPISLAPAGAGGRGRFQLSLPSSQHNATTTTFLLSKQFSPGKLSLSCFSPPPRPHFSLPKHPPPLKFHLWPSP